MQDERASFQSLRSMLSHHAIILNTLEIPQLIDTCVRNNSYDEALGLLALVSKLCVVAGGATVVQQLTRAHIFQKPHEHLVDFQQMLNSMRRVFAPASAACGLSHSYAGVFTRFCRRLATDFSGNKSLECVAVYNGMYECAQNGQHYALLQVVDTYLAE
eukprot:jgi/Ulvmu1/2212/UM013_0058.1